MRDTGGGRKSFLNFDINPDLIYENVEKVPTYKKTPKDLNSLYFALKNHFALYNLEDDHLENFISTMFFCEINENQVVFLQGDSSTAFFVISIF